MYTKVIVQNTSRIRLVDVQFPIIAIPPPSPVYEYSGELGQLVRVGPARGGIAIDHQCEWESTREMRHLSPISGERWPLARFLTFQAAVLAYRVRRIDSIGVNWRQIKG